MNGNLHSRCGRMTTFVAVTALGALLFAGIPAAANERISVVLDQAKVLELPPNTATIIVGNPMIADVTMINRNRQLILTGKSYGQTNMIALDARGNSVGESTLVVVGHAHGLVVQRGMDRETYSCEPRCQPTVAIGDSAEFTTKYLGTVTLRANASKGTN